MFHSWQFAKRISPREFLRFNQFAKINSFVTFICDLFAKSTTFCLWSEPQKISHIKAFLMAVLDIRFTVNCLHLCYYTDRGSTSRGSTSKLRFIIVSSCIYTNHPVENVAVVKSNKLGLEKRWWFFGPNRNKLGRR